LDVVASAIQTTVYDPSFTGLDWEAQVAECRQRIEQANSPGEMLTAVFSLVERLKDSHTVFVPPSRAATPTFGFEVKAFGDEVRVYDLKKDGPAAKAGLQLGDRILTINGFNANRDVIDLMMLYFRRLRPVAAMEITYSRSGRPRRRLAIQAEIKERAIVEDLTKGETIYRFIREYESEEREPFIYRKPEKDGIGFLGLPHFEASPGFLADLVKDVRDSRALIIDVRGNPGGIVDVLAAFVGHFEPEGTLLAELVGQKKTEPIRIKPRKPNLNVPLFILVDSQSASAAEMFARYFQRTGRGVVIGDRTSGRVTASRIFPHQVGTDVVVPYLVQVAVARVVFPGGEELEKRGITPDHFCLPTEDDLRAELDPCHALAYLLARRALGLPDEEPQEPAEEPKESSQ
ncbi:MAG: PDZ domain-containing protein, partial [Acidobacteria bacterium]|nr:PDZ domain-containing protein [Acidobacteriota bacterium]